MALPSTEGLRKRKDSLSDEFDSELDDNEMKAIVSDIEQDKIHEETPDTRWIRFKNHLKDWGETATIHGIPHMAQAHTVIAIVVWSIIMIISAVGFVYMFYSIAASYLAFNVVVQLNTGLDSEPFPSITFCNTNPYKLSEMINVPELNALLTVYQASADGSLS
ncbi:hypothetical protein CRE_13555 [Caenorhabditis remanei]|uniref:Uncharacterized protein n=1 Tax=Caenorhabditis remanei TaxID=31234 RepID=E3MR98_CAERE|nr:hypothetical protein CRE_13555 [Caenorhabditis remanei]